LNTEMSFSEHESGEIPVSGKIRGFRHDTNHFWENQSASASADWLDARDYCS
jgi:hypothetical protein